MAIFAPSVTTTYYTAPKRAAKGRLIEHDRAAITERERHFAGGCRRKSACKADASARILLGEHETDAKRVEVSLEGNLSGRATL
jgi:hypothetical protein